jgi:hypothetical protein
MSRVSVRLHSVAIPALLKSKSHRIATTRKFHKTLGCKHNDVIKKDWTTIVTQLSS